MHRILWLLFYKLLYAVIVYAYPFWHLKTYLLCIAINPSHFINIILSIFASQLNYLSSNSIHFILYISFSIFQIINFNSMHVIISISFFASLSLHLFLNPFLCIFFLCFSFYASLYVLFLCDISLSLSVYMNFLVKDVDHMLWFIIGWKIRSY